MERILLLLWMGLPIEYGLKDRIFYKWMPYWGKVIVISKNLQRHFDALSCSTFYLPPLIDSEESGLGEVCENGNPVKFIYAGAFSNSFSSS